MRISKNDNSAVLTDIPNNSERKLFVYFWGYSMLSPSKPNDVKRVGEEIQSMCVKLEMGGLLLPGLLH